MRNGRITLTDSDPTIIRDDSHGDVLDHVVRIERPRKRADIDGLRALAVVPVILFHARLPFFRGGFVGVDVFLVISGYLITSILYREMTSNAFSLLNFYERRVRRIIPAVYAMMAVTFVGAFCLFLPKDLRDTGQGVLATVTFLSNVLFYAKTNYFGETALSQPLLHTWSLAVEEQFYIIFPLLLWSLVRKAEKRTFAILAALFAVSLAASAMIATDYPAENFYLPMTRAWELGLGSLLAIALERKLIAPRSSEILAALGLALIIASFVLVDERSTFPGLLAVPVCLGTALLIYSGAGSRRTEIHSILAWKPIVFVGLISYSLYLWHWPAIVFANYYLLRPLSGLELALLLASIFLISALSWRFVEQPIRRGVWLHSRARLFGDAALGAVVLGAAGLASHISDGFPGRMSPEVLKLEAARAPEKLDGCAPPPGASYGGMCAFGTDPRKFIVWGDSHAGALRGTFDQVYADTHASGLLLSANACPPLVGVSIRQVGRERNHCEDYARQVLQMIDREKIDVVFLAADWWNDAQPGFFVEGDLGSGLDLTLAALKGRKVFIVDRVPGARKGVASAMARSLLYGRSYDLRPSVSDVARQRRTTHFAFASARTGHAFALIDPAQALCGHQYCEVQAKGRPLYSDDAHLTKWAAPYLAPLFERALTH